MMIDYFLNMEKEIEMEIIKFYASKMIKSVELTVDGIKWDVFYNDKVDNRKHH